MSFIHGEGASANRLPSKNHHEFSANLWAQVQGRCTRHSVIDEFSRHYVVWMSLDCRCDDQARVEEERVRRCGFTDHLRRRGPRVGGPRRPRRSLRSRLGAEKPIAASNSSRGARPQRQGALDQRDPAQRVPARDVPDSSGPRPWLNHTSWFSVRPFCVARSPAVCPDRARSASAQKELFYDAARIRTLSGRDRKRLDQRES
jgi:hypothetical protein